jgi:cyclic pyranopterin phosphate synthase
MIDITHKSYTHRKALAQAIVKVSEQQTIDAVINKTVPKGDVFEMAKTAGLFAVKRTSDIIPDCHPLPIEYTGVQYIIQGLEIHIQVEVQTIYKTGVEVEAMHGASVVALTMYDMLKPIDKGIEIHSIKLLEKKGGKSDFKEKTEIILKAAVIVCSDSISSGTKTDKAGKAIIKKLESYKIAVTDYTVIPDETEAIQKKVIALCSNRNYNLIVLTGGTGLSPRDITPEAIKPLLEREIPGVMETARNYGQSRMPFAMLSRGIAGIRKNTLILTLPGSSRGAEESMDALFPQILHIFPMMGQVSH